MRKTVSITISGQLFHIEEQGYKKLDAYLDSIREHFATYEDRSEIVSDIESRIAEQFAEKLTKARNVVSEKDVDDLIAHMGTVKDFQEFEGETVTEKKRSRSSSSDEFDFSRRLYRNPDDVMIAGVCSGIAKYFGIDTSMVRLAFVISLVFGGAGVLVYVVLWMVLPVAKTTTEKVEMNGQRLTLKRIEATIREKVPVAKEAMKRGTFRKIVEFPFMIIRQILTFCGRVLKFIVPVFLRLIGVGLLAAAVVGIMFLSFSFIMLATNGWEHYMDLPIRELAGNTTYYMALISGFFTLLLPAALLVLLGSSMMLMRNQFRSPFVISIIGLWVASALTVSVTVAGNLPQLEERVNRYMETNNTQAERSLTLTEFRSIEVRDNYSVDVVKGDALSAEVSGSQKAVEQLRTEVADGVLKIYREGEAKFCIICFGQNASITLTVPGDLENIAAVGGSDIRMDGVDLSGERIVSKAGSFVNVTGGALPDALTVEVAGGASAYIQSDDIVKTLTTDINAGSHLTISGEVDSIVADVNAGSTLSLTGSGRMIQADISAGSQLRGDEFAVYDADVRATSGGNITISVTNSVKAEARSGGEIYYYGTPTSVEKDEDPSGNIQSMDSEDDEEMEELNEYTEY